MCPEERAVLVRFRKSAWREDGIKWRRRGLWFAENLADPPAAVADGADVGQVEGLIWSDATGVDIVSVEVRGDRVAVPIYGDIWRSEPTVEFDISADEIYGAPRVQDLEVSGGIAAVEAVSQYFSMPLSGTARPVNWAATTVVG